SRTIGIGPGDFAIIGPSWNGKLPQGIKEYKSPTNMVWIIGRTQTNYNDISSVHAIQDQYKLTLLSDWSNSYVPSKNVAPVTKKDDESDKPPVQQIADLDTSTFFNYLNTLMVNNPPADADANAMKLFSQICVAPGQHFDLTHFSNDVAEAIKRGACEGLNKITSTISSGSINNWSVMIDNMGQYGTDYLFRAYVAFMGLGANLPKDAVYASCRIDHDGNQLTGKNKNRYTISFARGETPPVKAFWSLTMYNDQQFFVSNKLSCYALGSRDDLKYNSDGSLTFYLQNDEPDNSE
ncbi:1161_t:CDS:1, partial [Racocetra fulgida]